VASFLSKIWKSDYPSGTGSGTHTYPNGETYTGAWIKGKREGHGVLKLKCKRTFEGEFVNGFPVKGVYTDECYDAGWRYEGSYLSLSPEAYDIEGNIFNLKLHGPGVVTFIRSDIYNTRKVGDVWEGTMFKDSVDPKAKCVLKTVDGSRYDNISIALFKISTAH
jgi:hypothetical protein